MQSHIPIHTAVRIMLATRTCAVNLARRRCVNAPLYALPSSLANFPPCASSHKSTSFLLTSTMSNATSMRTMSSQPENNNDKYYPPSARMHVPTIEELPLYYDRFVPPEEYVNGIARQDPAWFSASGRPRVPLVKRVEGESTQECVRRILKMSAKEQQEEVYLREKEMLRLRRLIRSKFYKKSQHPGLRKKLRRSMRPLKEEFLALRDALHLHRLRVRREELNQPRLDVDHEARKRLDDAGIGYEPMPVVPYEDIAKHTFGA